MPVEDSLPLRTNHTNGPSSRSLRSTSVSQKEEHTHETGRAGAQVRARTQPHRRARHNGQGKEDQGAGEENSEPKEHLGHCGGFGCLHLFPRGPCNVFECFPWSLPLPPAFCLPSPPKDHRLRACCYLEPCAPRPPQSEQRANSQGGRAAKCSPMLHLLRFCPRQERRKSFNARQRTSVSGFRTTKGEEPVFSRCEDREFTASTNILKCAQSKHFTLSMFIDTEGEANCGYLGPFMERLSC